MRILSALLLVVAGAAAQAQDRPVEAGLDFFERRIRPVLVDHCYECHSAKTGKSKGGLVVDSRSGMLKGGDSGPAVVPGDPDRSRLIAVVAHADSEVKMPPKEKLPRSVVEDLIAWVRRGAPAAEPEAASSSSPPAGSKLPWSFGPLLPREPPPVSLPGWERNPVDHFVLARLQAKGLRPAPDADKRTLLRRATFDLLGLPPTPEEMEAFLRDEGSDAFEKVVERLLASPHYGERWGRHWLDVVRYADSSGNSSDFPVPDAWRYRNYVIDSFNRDTPFPRFVREQIAGDLLPFENESERRDHVVATGFLALARRFGGRRAEADHLTIEDAMDTMGRSILGLSLSCARCHDHKFDPIPTEDYYALYGILESTRFPFPGTEGDPRPKDSVLLLPPQEAESIRKPFLEELARLDAEWKRLRSADPKSGEVQEARKRREDFARTEPTLDWAFAVAEDRPHDARLQIAGNPRNLGRAVPRRFLSAAGGWVLPTGASGSGRLELAGWLTDPRNPLMPRVAVNRIWQHHFAHGLVRTPNDFGNRGAAPTNPELLDYLAARFQSEGGSLKSMHRLIMLSRTYRMSGAFDARSADLDPGDDLLWRFPPHRLDTEALRDAILAVGGDLDPTPGAAHPFPPAATWTFTQHHPFVAVYETDRRSVYVMQQRNQRHPYFALFDGADPNATTPERSRTTTPLQALYFLNNPFLHQQAERFARRLLRSRSDDAGRIDLAFRLALGRSPTEAEARLATAHLRSFAGGLGTADARNEAWNSLARSLLASNEFMTID